MNKILKCSLLMGALFGALQTSAQVVPLVYVEPVKASVNSGESIDLAIKVGAFDNQVCVVEGDIKVENARCTNLSLGEGLMAQTMPTCEKTHFVVGIPSCTKNETTLFNAKIQAAVQGSAKVILENVEVLGRGEKVSALALDGNYEIKRKQTVGVLESKVEVKNAPDLSSVSLAVATSGLSVDEQNVLAGKDLEASVASAKLPMGWVALFIVIILLAVIGWNIYGKKEKES